MKIKRFKLKDNITKNDLRIAGFRQGGAWVIKDAELFKSQEFVVGRYRTELSINIAFSSDIAAWNDFDNVLIIDEDYGQPYTPFYGDNYGKDINNFPVLEMVINKYNQFMSSLGIFEEINT